jgi:hypothetical protein
MPDPLKSVRPAVREILSYLLKNPEANDTITGIVEWWLLERRIEQCLSEVNEALVELVASGLVLAHQGADGQTHYRVNRKKRAEILKRLEASPRNP